MRIKLFIFATQKNSTLYWAKAHPMKKLLKDVIYFLLSLFRYRGAVVLMYHSVGDSEEFFTVSEKEFTRQMKYLSEKNFNVIRAKELVEILENNLPLPKKTVVITFDDGYEDNYLTAMPILKKYNFPAIVFVSTANIGKATTGVMGTEFKIISTDAIKEMDKSGLIDIESHSHEHIKLPSIGGLEVDEQLSASQRILKGILSKDVDLVAYPSGKVNEGVVEIAKEYFRAGFGVQKGRVVHGDDIMVLKRNSVDSKVSLTQFKGISVFGRI